MGRTFLYSGGVIVLSLAAMLTVGCCGHCGKAQAASSISDVNMPLSGDVVKGVRVIKMTAHRFAFEPNMIVVKKGEPVRLEITSTDVMHGFALEKHNVDIKLPPNQTQIVTITPRQTGRFEYYCTVFCGLGHGKMRGYMIVEGQ